MLVGFAAYIKAWVASLSEVHREVRCFPLTFYVRTESLFLAAVFFAVYDTLKQHPSLPAHLSPVTHVISASIAEVVCVFLSLLLSITPVLLILLLCARQLVSFAYPQK